jgi:hypothetical protein
MGPPEHRFKRGGIPLYNHREELRRSFHASGAKIFQEMSRCWKCRFMYHYQIPRPGSTNCTGLTAEEPTQTSYVCNSALSCAEDLCHQRCSGLHRGHGNFNDLVEELVFPTYWDSFGSRLPCTLIVQPGITSRSFEYTKITSN